MAFWTVVGFRSWAGNFGSQAGCQSAIQPIANRCYLARVGDFRKFGSHPQADAAQKGAVKRLRCGSRGFTPGCNILALQAATAEFAHNPGASRHCPRWQIWQGAGAHGGS
jgi:hypothetical protein